MSATMVSEPNATIASARPLARMDLDGVVAIDAALVGRSRRSYVERRLAAALREPAAHVQFGAADADGLAGFLLARVLQGEFGVDEHVLRLELVGVRKTSQRRGVAAALLGALEGWCARHGIAEIRTVAAWRDAAMLAWLGANGFALAPAHVIDRAVAPEEERAVPSGETASREVNYGAQPGNDFERLARDVAEVRSIAAADLGDIVRIDRRITGRDRTGYIASALAEAMLDSAIRVSLTARLDAHVVGFAMARVDLGDFGRIEPVAVLDTIGVDPDYAHRRVGHALLSQLVLNLAALGIERIETIVAPRDLALLGWLYDAGFAPSQRLPFAKRLDVAR